MKNCLVVALLCLLGCGPDFREGFLGQPELEDTMVVTGTEVAGRYARTFKSLGKGQAIDSARLRDRSAVANLIEGEVVEVTYQIHREEASLCQITSVTYKDQEGESHKLAVKWYQPQKYGAATFDRCHLKSPGVPLSDAPDTAS